MEFGTCVIGADSPCNNATDFNNIYNPVTQPFKEMGYTKTINLNDIDRNSILSFIVIGVVLYLILRK